MELSCRATPYQNESSRVEHTLYIVYVHNRTVEHGFLLLQAMMLLTSIRNLISASFTWHVQHKWNDFYSDDYKLAFIVRVSTVTLIFVTNWHAVIHAPIGNQVSFDSTARAYTILGWVSSCSIWVPHILLQGLPFLQCPQSNWQQLWIGDPFSRCTYMYVCMHVCMHVCMYVCMYECTYVVVTPR